MRLFQTPLRCCLFLWLLSAPLAWGDAQKGEAYFNDTDQGNCASCHYPDGRRLVGPGLQGVTSRHSDEWLDKFLKDPQQVWQSDHPETLELKKRVRKTRAPVTVCRKEHMTPEVQSNLMDYLKTLE